MVPLAFSTSTLVYNIHFLLGFYCMGFSILSLWIIVLVNNWFYLIQFINPCLYLLCGKGPKSWGQSWQGSSLRYLTYLGMCLSTCIILQSSTSLAALVGLCVAAYISLSEYSIQNEDANSGNTLNGAQIVQ